MSFLKSLKFAAFDQTQPSPLEKKRSQLIANLQDQLILLEHPKHSRTRRKTVRVPSHYELMGVDESASVKEINAA